MVCDLVTRSSGPGSDRRCSENWDSAADANKGMPLADEFDTAKERADTLGQLVRGSEPLPLARRRRRINLYSLFVERAMSLIKPDGFVGLLTPVGHLR